LPIDEGWGKIGDGKGEMKKQDKNIDSFIEKIQKVKPKLAGIYFFGSRARGTARPDSDYDLLILTKEKDLKLKSRLYDAAVDVYMNSGADLSLKIIKEADFNRMKKIGYPFVDNILKEGIKLG